MTYCNPLWPGYFADPFVLRASDGYYAYGTGPAAPDGREFPVLFSTNLCNWKPLGGALIPLTEPRAFTYWAPEVAEAGGKFYMYYSASLSPTDDGHRIRVAVADQPAGPFRDVGRPLMPELGFSIDASPFQDPRTGRRFLFFAADFESDAPSGTGLSVVELGRDMLSVTGAPHCVVCASAPWQIYERNRDYKGRIWEAWNCVEGPSAVFHGGRYYLFYSGGAWHSENYGVGFAVADDPLGQWRDDAAQHGPTVLKGVPGKVIGPGHNSTTVGPDGRTLFMVYHAWDADRTARRMCIDPIEWTSDGPRVKGPTQEPQPVGI